MNEEFSNAVDRFRSLTEGRVARKGRSTLFVGKPLHTQRPLFSRIERRLTDNYSKYTRKMLRAKTERQQRHRRHSRAGVLHRPRDIFTSPVRQR